MKKNPKTPSLSINTLSDRKLACAALALCLMGGTALTAQASGNRGVKLLTLSRLQPPAVSQVQYLTKTATL